MKIKNQFFLIFSLLVFFYSCEQKVKTENEVPRISTENNDADTLHSLTEKVQEVEDLCENELIEMRSLIWEKTGKNNPELIQVITYNDKAGTPYKIIEDYNNGETPIQEGQRIYYLNNGKLFAYYHQYDKWVNDVSAQLIDEQHFFDEESGETVLSRQRSADAIEDLEDSPWENIKSETPNLELAESVLKSKKPFETHFLSFIESDYGLFLLLGEPKDSDKPRYQTAVAVNPEEPFIQDLIQNKEKYKFKQLAISFSFEGGGSQPLFTVLHSAEWVD